MNEESPIPASEPSSPRQYNAIKHGLLSREVLLPGESKKRFLKLKEDLLEEYKPQGPLENILVDQIIACTWRLKRSFKVESDILAQHSNKSPYNNDDRESYFSGPSYSKPRKLGGRTRKNTKGIAEHTDLEVVLGYQKQIEKTLYRAITELTKIQHNRKTLIYQQNSVVDRETNTA